MLDGVGNAVKPDFINVYYKRFPASSPACNPQLDARAKGRCIDLPNGIRFIFGYNMTTMTGGPADTQSWDIWTMSYECWGSEDGTVKGVAGRFQTIGEVVAAGCPVGAQLHVAAAAPECWDGINLDSPDHRSHMSYAIGEDKGFGRQCPSTHPYLIPTMTYQFHYTVNANFTAGKWLFASDQQMGKPAGVTLHMDYWEAWSPTVKALWHTTCMNKQLSCASGDLGNGTLIKGSGVPTADGPNNHSCQPVNSFAVEVVRSEKVDRLTKSSSSACGRPIRSKCRA